MTSNGFPLFFSGSPGGGKILNPVKFIVFHPLIIKLLPNRLVSIVGKKELVYILYYGYVYICGK